MVIIPWRLGWMVDGRESVWMGDVLPRLLRCFLRGCEIAGSSRDEVGRLLFVFVRNESVVSSKKNDLASCIVRWENPMSCKE